MTSRQIPVPGVKEHRALVLLFSLSFTLALLFALGTGHAWEDYYITYRASENLAMGHGLVFTEGEPLHTFTSPLGVLLPALVRFVLGEASPESVLWGFRLISSAMFAGAVALIARTVRQQGLAIAAVALTAGLIAFDAKSIDFTINGMETGMMLLALAALVAAMTTHSAHRWLWIGLAWAALLWCRPDSLVYFGALAAGTLLFPPPGSITRSTWVGIFFKAAIVCAVLYLPWIIFTSRFYGTPIPHTITAKGLFVHHELLPLLGSFMSFPLKLLTPSSPFRLLFSPAYVDAGGWPLLVRLVSIGLGAVAALYWVWPRGRALARAVSFTTFCGGFYLDAICPFPAPWYLPFTAFFAAITLGFIADGVLRRSQTAQIGDGVHRTGLLKRGVTAGVACLLLGQFVLTTAVGVQLHYQQALIEDGNRRIIGTWLKDNAASRDDSVFLECLGYIGYFSGLKMFDHPGLASREMVDLRRSLRTDDWAILVNELKPTWLVLRPKELVRLEGSDGGLLDRSYRRVKTFDVAERIAQVGWLPGRAYLESDQTFHVYHRRETSAP